MQVHAVEAESVVLDHVPVHRLGEVVGQVALGRCARDADVAVALDLAAVEVADLDVLGPLVRLVVRDEIEAALVVAEDEGRERRARAVEARSELARVDDLLNESQPKRARA